MNQSTLNLDRALGAGVDRILFVEEEGISTGGHLDHVVEFAQKHREVRYLVTDDVDEAREAAQWADLVWMDWVTPLTVELSRAEDILRDKPVVVRLIGFEMFTPAPVDMNWGPVDRVLFLAEHKREIFKQRLPEAPVESSLVRMGIDMDRFSIPDGKENNKHLLLIGHLNFRKGLPMLLHFFERLVRRDPEFRLTIRGDWQDLRYQLGVSTLIRNLGLQDRVTYVSEWIEDLNAWYADKSHILSFSIEESFHCTVGEGMAAGLQPCIHAWLESRDIWPPEFIFSDLDEFLELATRDRYEPARHRALLERHQLTRRHHLQRVTQALGETVSSYRGVVG